MYITPVRFEKLLRAKILTTANGHYRLKENGFSFKLQITAPLRCLFPISRFENATIL